MLFLCASLPNAGLTRNGGEDAQEQDKKKKKKRKRKDENEGDDEQQQALARLPRTDKQEICSIVQKGLWSNESENVTEALHSLVNLLEKPEAQGDENTMIAYHGGAPLAIATVMSRNPASHEIQEAAIDCLFNISLRDETEMGIIYSGGFDRCIRALDLHSDHPGLQAAGCVLIANLWCCPDARQTVLDEHGLAVVLDAMEHNSHDEDVQRAGLDALINLLTPRHAATDVKLVVDNGGIELAVKAMENHPTFAEVQTQGCSLLASIAMCNNGEYRNRIIQAKGLVAVVEAKRNHQDNDHVLNSVRDAVKAIGI
jgi:intracellular sulfur oxidation DsrE/DsrF family protein